MSSTAIVVAPKAELAQIEQQVKAWLPECRQGFVNFMLYRFLIGCALIRAKEIVPTGAGGDRRSQKIKLAKSANLIVEDEPAGFLQWKRQAFPAIPIRTLQDHKAFAERVLKAHPEIESVDVSKLPADKCDDIFEKLRECTNGKDITSGVRCMELIEDATAPGGFRPNEKQLREWLKKHHAAHAGTPWAKLPKPIQKEFKEHVAKGEASRYARMTPAEAQAAKARNAATRWRPVTEFLRRELGEARDEKNKKLEALWPHLPIEPQDDDTPHLLHIHSLLTDLRDAITPHVRNHQ